MAVISPAMIKELRDRTGVGMGKCKEALEEAQGDMELAISNLRKAGLASAVKKEGRATNEGMIGFADSTKTLAIVEVNAETDFVVKNDRFKDFLENVSKEIAETNPESLESFLKQKYSKEPTLTVDEFRATLVQTIGENIQIKRLKTFAKSSDLSIGVYSHLGGKILTVVVLEGASSEEALAKDIAMHIAAASPDYLCPEEVPADVLNHEKEIVRSQIQNKPKDIIDKIVDGKVNSFFDQVCLTRQNYIRDDSLKIQDLVDKRAKEINKPLKLKSFIRWNVGQ